MIIRNLPLHNDKSPIIADLSTGNTLKFFATSYPPSTPPLHAQRSRRGTFEAEGAHSGADGGSRRGRSRRETFLLIPTRRAEKQKGDIPTYSNKAGVTWFFKRIERSRSEE